MKLFLHIGTDKTGSTAIQNHLYVNRAWLLERGVYIPLTGLGKDNGHGDLIDGLDAEKMSALTAELASAQAAGHEYAVLSSESMCFLDPQQITQIGAALASEDLWLLVYLREQADIVQSGYLQSIKTELSPVDIADFQGLPLKLSRIRALRYCYSPMRNYARLLQRWMKIIPKGQVVAREFQREKLKDNNVVDDFLGVLGLTVDSQFIRFSLNTNISLDVESAVLVNDFDRLNDAGTLRKDHISSLLSIIHSEGYSNRYFLSASRVASIRRRYKKSNLRIGKIIGSSMPDLFLQPPLCTRTYTVEELRLGVDKRKEKLKELQKVPMLFGSRISEATFPPELLVSGWRDHRSEGTWSQGPVSILQFRTPFWMINHETRQLSVFMKGRYRGDHTRSRLIINDDDLGWRDMRRLSPRIYLPMSELRNSQIVTVTIIHDIPAEAWANAPENKDYGSVLFLEKFGIQFADPQ